MDLDSTHYLGRRAFLLFLCKRLKLALGILLGTLLIWFLRDRFPIQYGYLADFSINSGLMLFAAVFVVRLAQTYIEYHGFSFKFEKEFFQLSRGYIIKNEIAVVYHQIQNANIRRDMIDRLMGVSQLVIVMAGGNEAGGTRTDIVLPALDKWKARMIQKELMRQARIHAYKTPREESGADFDEEEDEGVIEG